MAEKGWLLMAISPLFLQFEYRSRHTCSSNFWADPEFLKGVA